VQGKAELVTELLPLLQECYRDKLDDMLRHQAGARFIAQYDFNNTYQYVINREDVQLTWLAAAIVDLGGTVPDEPAGPPPLAARPGPPDPRTIFDDDARAAQAFVDRWRPRAEALSHARHRLMLQVILGETLEQKRFFELARAGRTDLLGRRADQLGPAVGEVLPTRWQD
jgi:hypothetical protein